MVHGSLDALSFRSSPSLHLCGAVHLTNKSVSNQPPLAPPHSSSFSLARADAPDAASAARIQTLILPRCASQAPCLDPLAQSLHPAKRADYSTWARVGARCGVVQAWGRREA
jgi:hypothetical protein